MDLSKGTLPVTLVGTMIATIIGASAWFSAKTNAVIDSIDAVEDSVALLGTELRREIADLRADMTTRAEYADVLSRLRLCESVNARQDAHIEALQKDRD